jgi:hypothetical protein
MDELCDPTTTNAPFIVKYSDRIFRIFSIIYFFQDMGKNLPFEAIDYAIL